MLLEIVTRAGAAIGAAIAAAWKAARAPTSRGKGPVYVRLSAEDSDRVEKIEALLVRLIALEEQTQRAIERLTSEMTAARLEQARRHGWLEGRLETGRAAG